MTTAAPIAQSITKAEALRALEGRLTHAHIPAFLHFDRGLWVAERQRVLRDVCSMPWPNIAVRSSARGEDTPGHSLAGHFRTRLSITNDPGALADAIDDVAAGLRDDRDQILVQEMVSPVATAGVVLTRDPHTGSPYYSIEYDDSGRTDRVTGGGAPTARLVLLRDRANVVLPSDRFFDTLRAVREIESHEGDVPLEIEYAVNTAGRIHLLQTRRLDLRVPADPRRDRRVAHTLDRLARRLECLSAPDPLLAGSRTVLGQMCDWNPAELLGTFARPLARSLFATLVSDRVWSHARRAVGYRPVPRALVRPIQGRPYVDVRASFNSFLPHGLCPSFSAEVVDQWIDHLCAHPDAHDKVEFEIAQTTHDLDFVAVRRRRFGGRSIDGRERDYRERLLRLTRRALALGADASLPTALSAVERLAAIPSTRFEAPSAGLGAALRLCRRIGTFPFAILARHAFIAESMLRSAVTREAWSPERSREFRASIRSVAGEMQRDLAHVRRGQIPLESFFARYGHLRPGTFDVTSLPYRARPELVTAAPPPTSELDPAPFVATPGELERLTALTRENGLGVDGEHLLRYAALAIHGREYAKFVFSRHLSVTLESLAAWGRREGISRDDLSFLTVREIASRRTSGRRLLRRIETRRRGLARAAGIRLGPLLRHRDDLYQIYESHRPTFVSDADLVGVPVRLDAHHRCVPEVTGRIVCVENADPGFDWIFAHRPLALVTQWGGGNSHMALRCYETGLPAALGVGEPCFLRAVNAASVELRCAEGILRCL